MSYQALARTWRPRNFSELVGQTHVRTALENALAQGRLHPALLFSGTRGVGKTTLARIIAKCLNCETGVTAEPCGQCGACQEIEQGRFVDLIEVDAASRTKVEETRELLDNVPYAPARGRYKVYLIDEVHMLTKHSFNALLKTLEEPPGHVQFLFATTDPQKLPITILSRCLQFHLQRIKAEDIAQRMRHILDEEKIQADDSGLQRLARAADGSLRDGLSLLDQAIAFGGGQVSGESVGVMLGSIERRDLMKIVLAIADNDASAAWQAIDAIETQGLDFAEVLEELCRLWQRLAVGQQVPEVWDEVERADLGPLAARFKPADLQVFYQIAVNARRDLDWAPDPRSGFEMTILRTLAFYPDSAAAGGAPVASAPQQSAPPTTSVASAASAQADPGTASQTGGLKPGALDWSDLLSRLALSGGSRIVAEGCAIKAQSATALELQVGSEVAELCTATVEKNLRKALRQVLGAEFTVTLAHRATPTRDSGATVSPEEAFLAHPGVRKAMELFDAEIQPGTLRISANESGDRTIN